MSVSTETTSLHPHPTEMASHAHLIYVDGEQMGYLRVRRGRGFAFRDGNGHYLRDAEILQRVHSLVIPPAWTDVWICADPSGHIQATGRDEKGRKQYIYHADWTQARDYAKYSRLLPFAEAAVAALQEGSEALKLFKQQVRPTLGSTTMANSPLRQSSNAMAIAGSTKVTAHQLIKSVPVLAWAETLPRPLPNGNG
jgi:DNA topoisomerase-1